MRLAILAKEPYQDDSDIYAQFEPEVFRERLIRYTLELGDVSKAFDKVVQDLKDEIIHQ